MVLRASAFGALLPVLVLSAAAPAQDLSTIPASLANAAGVLCIRVSMVGEVTGAFVVTSTGDARRDSDLIAWARQLHWPVEPDASKRGHWSPMPVAFGAGHLPTSPKSCAPPDGAGGVPPSP